MDGTDHGISSKSSTRNRKSSRLGTFRGLAVAERCPNQSGRTSTARRPVGAFGENRQCSVAPAGRFGAQDRSRRNSVAPELFDLRRGQAGDVLSRKVFNADFGRLRLGRVLELRLRDPLNRWGQAGDVLSGFQRRLRPFAWASLNFLASRLTAGRWPLPLPWPSAVRTSTRAVGPAAERPLVHWRRRRRHEAAEPVAGRPLVHRGRRCRHEAEPVAGRPLVHRGRHHRSAAAERAACPHVHRRRCRRSEPGAEAHRPPLAAPADDCTRARPIRQPRQP